MFGGHPVQMTTDDALQSKCSAVLKGYYHDPYLQLMLKKPTIRAPLINRGYYSRVAAIRRVLLVFFDLVPANQKLQIVNLGGGLDTIFFWINDVLTGKLDRDNLVTPFSRDFVYFEIDFPEVQQKKTQILMKKEKLWSNLLEGTEDLPNGKIGKISTKKFRMVSEDLRNLGNITDEIKTAGFNPDLPTIFLAECVLIYLDPHLSDEVIHWASSLTSAPSAFVTYEQILPDDPFGRTMVRNLEARGCPLLGIHAYPTIAAQKLRYEKFGWRKCSVADLNQIYDHHLEKSDILRIQSLELFDEMEEWRLMQAHYVIAVAVKGSELSGRFEFLGNLTKIWAHPTTPSQLPRFTTLEARNASNRDLTLLARESLSEQEKSNGQMSSRGGSYLDLLGLEETE